MILSLENAKTNFDDVITTFRVFDTNNQGFITKEDLRDVLSRLSEVHDSTIDNIMKSAGTQAEETGLISKDDFISIFS